MESEQRGVDNGDPGRARRPVTEAVLDASVLIKWFKTAGEAHVAEAGELRARFSRRELLVIVPPLLFLELLNAAARRWAWDAAQLEQLAQGLDALDFQIEQPSLAGIAYWCSRGLTAYDACYL